MSRSIEKELVENLTSLISSESRLKLYDEAVSVLSNIVKADLVKFAKAEEDLLIPIISTNGGNTGPSSAVSVSTTIPGAVYNSGDGCLIDDLFDVRGSGTTPQRALSTNEVGGPGEHRSMLCVPVGEHGVIIACHRAPGAFDDDDLAVATAIGELTDRVASIRHDGSSRREAHPSDLLEEISRIVSHDVVNKVTIAKGHLELLREHDNDTHFDFIENALESIQSISEMVVTIARSGQVINDFAAIELGSTAETVFAQLDNPDADLVIESSNTIQADEICLRRILDNLYRNAIEHSQGPVRIEVGVFEGGFFISDDGPGIPKALREDVFQPGFTTESGHEGSGLSIVKLLADAHGWEVAITDGRAGGTRVEISSVKFGE